MQRVVSVFGSPDFAPAAWLMPCRVCRDLKQRHAETDLITGAGVDACNGRPRTKYQDVRVLPPT